ncbi:MAG: PEP-CTERM sorting domain-containing protein [Chthoniobacterales bacterium]
MKIKTHCVVVAIASGCFGLLSHTQAANVSTWTGASSSDWNTVGNWNPTAIPSNGWNGDRAFFDSTATSGTVNLNLSITAMGITFDSAGWTIENATAVLNFTQNTTPTGITNNISSGTNTINLQRIRNNSAGDNIPIITIAGGTLVLGGEVYRYGNSAWNFSGGGKVVQTGTDTSQGLPDLDAFTGEYYFANGLSGTAWGAKNLGGTNALLGGVGQISMYGGHSGVTISGTIAPGGDGDVIADPIGTIEISGLTSINASGVSMNTGSAFQMDIGTMLGSNDKIEFSNLYNRAFNYSNGTLDLKGTTIQDGTYILFEDIDATVADFSGTFSSVLFNGSAINPSNFTMNYGTDLISVTISGLAIPEPSSAMFLGLSAAALVLRRKQKA